jgi:hypothetical protein
MPNNRLKRTPTFSGKGNLPEETTMTKLKLLCCAAAVLGGSVFATAASALPLAPLASDTPANVEQVRLVCGPFGCRWRPNYYMGYRSYGYYPRAYLGGYPRAYGYYPRAYLGGYPRAYLGGGWGYRRWHRL